MVPSRRWFLACAGLCALLTGAAGRDVLFRGRSFVPSDFLERARPWAPPGTDDAPLRNRLHQDIVEFYATHAVATSAALAGGRLFLWNPHIFCGLAVGADPQLGTFYPPRILSYLLFPPLRALDAFILAHYFFAGLAMFAFARSFGAGGMGALAAALTWMLCGQVMVWFKYGSGLVAAVFLPLLATALHRAYEKRCAGRAAGAGALWALLFTGAHPQLSFLSLAWAAIYGAFRARAAGWRWSLRAGSAFAAAGVGLAAIQLFPFLESLASSQKMAEGTGSAFARPWRAPLLLATLLWQRAFGSPIDRLDANVAWLGGNFFEFQAYMGLAPLGLAAMAWGRGKDLWAAALGSLAIATIYPLWAILTGLLPFLNVLVPHRLFLFAFAVSALAGLGFDRALQRPPGKRLTLLLAGGLTAVVAAGAAGALSGARWITAANPAYGAFLAAAVASGVALVVLRMPARPLLKGSAVLAAIAADLLPGWLAYNAAQPPLPPEPAEMARLPRGDRVLVGFVTPYWKIGVHNTLMLYGLSTPSGFASQYPRAYAEFAAAAGAETGPRAVRWRPADARILRALNVAVVLDERGSTALPALPRAWLVDRVENVPDPAERLRRISDPSFDFTRAAILEAALPHPVRGGGRVESLGPHAYRVEAEGPALLVVSETCYPGWECRVNGAPREILRANHAFRAVALSAGESRVEFAFRPASVRYGAWLGALTLAAMASSWAASRWASARRRKASPEGGR